MATDTPPTEIRFGTDGWRAVIAEDYTFANVRACAQAVAERLKAAGGLNGEVVVAFDTRFASDRFAAAAAEVIAANGIRVALASAPTPTPTASFAVASRGAAGGIVITASHNPGSYNGFKVKSPIGSSAAPEETAAIEKIVAAVLAGDVPVRRLPLDQAAGSGLATRFDPSGSYLDQVRTMADVAAVRNAGMRVVVDAMYGAGGGFLPRLLAGGKLELAELHGRPNPAFPGMSQPEPIAANLRELSREVVKSGAAVGVALDGDADRVGIVDETGRYLTTLEVYSLIAYHLLKRRGERGDLVRTTTMSAMVDRIGKEFGVGVHHTSVGFKYVGPRMLETDALMGGEESGGYAFRGHVPERDGILSGLIFLEAMVASGKRPSELLAELHELTGPHYFERVDLKFPEDQRARMQARVDSAEPQTLGGIPVASIDRRDGLWVRLEGGGWGIVRFSGTEPLLRTYAEASDRETVARLLADLRRLAGLP